MATATTSDSPTLAASASLLKMWAALAAVLLLALGGTALAYMHASQTADCVNTVLGLRGPLTNADHANERMKIEDQSRAERDQARGLAMLSQPGQANKIAGFAMYQRGTAEFIKALDDWKTRDDAITKKKNAHPLGVC